MQEVSRRLAKTTEQQWPIPIQPFASIFRRSRRWPIRCSANGGLWPLQPVAAECIN